MTTETDALVALARAEAFDDAAYVIKNAYKHGAKAETEEEWLQMSLTFSNQAAIIRQNLAKAEGRSDD